MSKCKYNINIMEGKYLGSRYNLELIKYNEYAEILCKLLVLEYNILSKQALEQIKPILLLSSDKRGNRNSLADIKSVEHKHMVVILCQCYHISF